MSILAIIALFGVLWLMNFFSGRPNRYQKEKIAVFKKYWGRQLTMDEAQQQLREEYEIDKKYNKPWTR
jgi:hypothetical protein